ncbi:PLP-dependent aminotransferase family protein [Gynuella sunshinyii]|uniref:Transcriptional regulator containing a DNA-binding HTH domain and an aminotransferase domain (MocR family-like protein) n=1 Tax=Gynuella sunshinyii YC6258 TaxID=1445510 RepID=A0A0C5VJB1_9GAMM|nr:PLP-dependent aminotransferase family protein [Gynuella sunshinyii]AJQ94722.1 transcriptional regulator containing a DNA-binding HTH domain and an aminotransferase domain (MocR family-like protein) [Gynuella sunshinyii YC6258]
MEGSLYAQLADKMTEQIRHGAIAIGERMPSVRHLSRQERVSISTVMAAYSLLEERGWVEARPKSGYYACRQIREALAVPSASVVEPDPVIASTSQLVMDVQRDGFKPHAINFCRATPALDFPISRHLRQTYTRLSRTQQHLGVSCLPEGPYVLRQQIARHAMDAGVAVSPDSIVTTAGSLNAMGLCLQVLTRPGDLVAVESPCYYGILQLIEAYGLKAIEVPTHPETGLSLEALKLAMEQWPLKVILTVPSFSNPLGCSIPDERKKALVRLLEQYQVPLIEDDVYGDLYFGTHRPGAIKAFDKQGLVLLCSSLSKTIDPQLRVGWVLAGRYYEEILHRKFVNMLSTPVLPQLVCAEVLGQGIYERHLRQAREAYRQRYQRLVDLVSETFPAITKISRPQGGIVAWLEMPENFDSTELYHFCRNAGVLIAPGEIFSINKQFKHCFRLNYAPRWTREREAAIRKLGQWISDQIEKP